MPDLANDIKRFSVKDVLTDTQQRPLDMARLRVLQLEGVRLCPPPEHPALQLMQLCALCLQQCQTGCFVWLALLIACMHDLEHISLVKCGDDCHGGCSYVLAHCCAGCFKLRTLQLDAGSIAQEGSADSVRALAGRIPQLTQLQTLMLEHFATNHEGSESARALAAAVAHLAGLTDLGMPGMVLSSPDHIGMVKALANLSCLLRLSFSVEGAQTGMHSALRAAGSMTALRTLHASFDSRSSGPITLPDGLALVSCLPVGAVPHNELLGALERTTALCRLSLCICASADSSPCAADPAIMLQPLTWLEQVELKYACKQIAGIVQVLQALMHARAALHSLWLMGCTFSAFKKDGAQQLKLVISVAIIGLFSKCARASAGSVLCQRNFKPGNFICTTQVAAADAALAACLQL